MSPRLRRQLIRAVVEENVYNKAGKRVPVRRPPRFGRWLALGLAISTAGAAALLLRPEGWSASTRHPLAAVPSAVAAPVARPLELASGPLQVPSLAALGGTPLDAAVFPVSVRRIVLDPGHGGKDVGTVTAGGLFEKDVALDIALRLRDLLRQHEGVEVLLTRDRDAQVSLRDRARFANDAQADLFVSIHLNSLGPVATRGVETFFLGPTADPYLVQLASRENGESGYALADVRRLLDGIYLDLRGRESQQLAGAVQHSLFDALDRQPAGVLRDRGVKSAPFLVLVATEMPAILAEVSCLSSQQDAELLATEVYRQQIADALRQGIEAYTLELSRQATSAVAVPARARAVTAPSTKGNAT